MFLGGVAFAVDINWELGYGIEGEEYSDYVEAIKGTGPYSWSSSGKLPSGLNFSVSGDRYYLKGIPLEAGDFSFTVYVTDLGSYYATASKNLSIHVYDKNGVYPKWTDYFSSHVGEEYEDYLLVDGGTPPYNWTYSGNVPGLNFVEASSPTTTKNDRLYLRGTPTQEGDFLVQFTVTDANGTSVSFSNTVAIGPKDMKVLYSFKTGTVGEAYSDYIMVTGGIVPYKWSCSGDLPANMKLEQNADGTKYTLSGTPNQPGQYTVELSVEDKFGWGYFDFPMTISIDPAPTPASTEPLKITWAFANGVVGQPYYDFVKAEGGTGEGYVWTYSGDLPVSAGLNNMLKGDNNQLLVFYNDNGPTKSGTYKFTLYVKDSANTMVSKNFTIKLYEPLSISNSYTFPNKSVGDSYNYSVIVTGGDGVYTWEDYEGSIPDGLTLSCSGNKATMSGIPSTAGEFNFTLHVSSGAYAYYKDGESSKTPTYQRSFKINIVSAGGTAGEANAIDGKNGNTSDETPSENEKTSDSNNKNSNGNHIVIQVNGNSTEVNSDTKVNNDNKDDNSNIQDDSTNTDTTNNTNNTTNETTNNSEEKSLIGSLAGGGGGGCNAGFGVLGLMFLGAVLISKRSR